MIKLWRFLSVSIVVAVCLGLALMPAVGSAACPTPPAATAGVCAFDDANPEESVITVTPGGSFDMNITVQNDHALSLMGTSIFMTFDPSLLNVTGIADSLDWPTSLPENWDNTDGWLTAARGVSLDPCMNNAVIQHAVVHFQSTGVGGTTTVNFTSNGTLGYYTEVTNCTGVDILSWSSLQNVTVIIAGNQTLWVNVTGNGDVDITGAGTPSSYPNTTEWPLGANVTLEAVPAAGWMFHNWTGDITGPADVNLSYVIMDTDKNVTANFAVAPMPGCNNGSLNVAFVPNPYGPGGGELPTNNSAFSNFSFTNVPYASVNATTLASYDTVVLIMCDPMNQTTPSQRTDIVNWVSNGGKLIVYDSECLTNATINNSWLPYPYTTYCPGAVGGNKYGYPWVDLWIVENNTLSSSDPMSPYYINTTMIAYDTDAAGDQNVFITRSAGWCGDMMGTNAVNSTYSTPPGTTGYSHGYSHYNKGLFIYNGLDIDVLGSATDPTANTGAGYLAKIWLLELSQPWDNVTGTSLCGLPCAAPIPPPTPGCVTPTAAFSATPITGLAPLGVQFTDKSTGNVTSWRWDFGDGKTSTAHNPTHTYMKEGGYTVKLKVSGPCGEDTETKVKYINVLSSTPVEPVSLSCSGLYISPQQVKPGQEVTISISVANTGGETGSYNAVLYINSAVEDSQSVSVPGGTTKNVIFTVSKTKAGVYDVSICGQSGQFEVVHTGWFAGGLGTGGIIAIVVIVIVLIVAVIFILRGTARPE